MIINKKAAPVQEAATTSLSVDAQKSTVPMANIQATNLSVQCRCTGDTAPKEGGRRVS